VWRRCCGDPVIQLQSNFGGGKAHSMLALHLLFSGAAPGELLGVDEVLEAAEVGALPRVNRVVLVISLPASEAMASPHAQANDEAVGGVRRQQALARLSNAVGRVESSWRPASAEEGFEIVRRRLFWPLADRRQFVTRDRVARSFSDFYRSQRQELPAAWRWPTPWRPSSTPTA
jgi:predicted AAA+ superfamily ATPase